MPRGGRRTGAGAPKGNWNGLKTGRYSPRFRQAVLALRHDAQFIEVYRLLMRADRAAHTSASRRDLRAQFGRIERLLGQLLRRRLVTQIGTADSTAPLARFQNDQSQDPPVLLPSPPGRGSG